MPRANDELVDVLRGFGGDRLRDVWLFDEVGYESLYLRDDVRERVADVDVGRFIDNERYGYVTRDTYEALHYTDYGYTVRGLDAFVQFRTFLPREGDVPLGVLASFDPGETYDFDVLQETVREAAAAASEPPTVPGDD